MQILERPTFESEEARAIYRHVEGNGTVAIDEARAAVGLSQTAFREHLDRLKSGGYVEERDGTLEIALDVGAEATHETGDFTYVVRPARNEDFEALVDTIEAVTSKRTYVVAERLAEELRYDDTVTRHTSVWSRVFFVATVDDDVVGWSHLELPQLEKLRQTTRATVGVREDYRGYGIGARLLDRALDWAEANDYLKVYNNVARTNGNAIAFLERHGWEEEAVHRNHYTIGHKQVDEVMLAYVFEESE